MNQTTLKNAWAYIQGNIRHALYYSNYSFLLPKHILEQIMYRINKMDVRCYRQGSCIMCGCSTTALQMADKACDKPCYPNMMSKKEWREYDGKMGK